MSLFRVLPRINRISIACPAITPSLGLNVITDPGFEQWTSPTNLTQFGESVSGTSTINQETVVVYSGSNACRMDIDALNSSAVIAQSALTAGIWYRFEIVTKAASGAPRIAFGVDPYCNFAIDTTYTQYVGTNRAVGVNFNVLRGTGAANNSIYVDDVAAYPITFSSMRVLLGQHGKNGSFSCTPTVADNTQAGMLLNYADDNNFVMLIVDRSRNGGSPHARVISKIGGTWTSVIAGAITYSAGTQLKVIANSGNYSLFYNNVQVGATTAIVETTLGTGVYGFNAEAGNLVGTVIATGAT